VLLPWPEKDPVAQASVKAFARALNAFGWVEGKNIQIDYRFGAGDPTLYKNAASLLDLSDEVGTIASGKSADVIAVDSSPLDDVSVLERVVFVMARGDVYRA
jgi:Amidohydrolase family